MIARRLRYKKTSGEPITIENFVKIRLSNKTKLHVKCLSAVSQLPPLFYFFWLQGSENHVKEKKKRGRENELSDSPSSSFFGKKLSDAEG